ncbi:hypothetical protein [Phaeovulum veldkampii]|uniref:hypothetical protein n=1 Tax=Phaeovulum veldkampii TaxID=33049 RepID=UPI0010DD7410|nr:hypothetical protein [Phaeovulum veldkampii]TDQ64543.1 hypothetical protein EV658_1014 [Phaeovulum veldkampii DSM 11550]
MEDSILVNGCMPLKDRPSFLSRLVSGSLKAADAVSWSNVFAWARIDEVTTTYTVGSRGAVTAPELLISGPKP